MSMYLYACYSWNKLRRAATGLESRGHSAYNETIMTQTIESTAPAARSDPVQMPARTRISATAGYYVAFVTLGLILAVTGPTLPSLAERTHVRLDEISIVFAVRSLGYLVGSLAGGHTFDRVRGHPVVGLMLA